MRLKKENICSYFKKGTNLISASRFLKPDDLKVFPHYVFGPWRRRGPIKNSRCDGLFLLFLKYIAPFPLRLTPAGGMSHFLLKQEEEGMWGGEGGGVDYIIAHKSGCGQIQNNIKMKKHLSVTEEEVQLRLNSVFAVNERIKRTKEWKSSAVHRSLFISCNTLFFFFFSPLRARFPLPIPLSRSRCLTRESAASHSSLTACLKVVNLKSFLFLSPPQFYFIYFLASPEGTRPNLQRMW